MDKEQWSLCKINGGRQTQCKLIARKDSEKLKDTELCNMEKIFVFGKKYLKTLESSNIKMKVIQTKSYM